MIKIIDYGKRSTIWFCDLNVGDTFLWNEQLYIKSDDERNTALNLDEGGEPEKLNDDTQVISVDIEIKVVR